MKISFIIPPTGQYTDNKNWLWWVCEELKKLDNEVLLNECSDDCDIIVCMTISQIGRFENIIREYSDIPFVMYNWDWFSFIDKTKSPWPEFVEWMKKSIDVWTASDDTARLCEKVLGIKHYTIYACSVLEEFQGGKITSGDYVVQASRRDKRYKRFDLFEQGCNELGIPFISCHPNKYSREKYIEIIRGCRLLVMAANEESNATLSSIEAAYCKKPLLLSDIEACKECWGDTAVYFKTDDLRDLKDKLLKLYKGEIKADVEGAYNLAMERYTEEAMAQAINKRLREIL